MSSELVALRTFYLSAVQCLMLQHASVVVVVVVTRPLLRDDSAARDDRCPGTSVHTHCRKDSRFCQS